jgi:hypothetical protein
VISCVLATGGNLPGDMRGQSCFGGGLSLNCGRAAVALSLALALERSMTAAASAGQLSPADQYVECVEHTTTQSATRHVSDPEVVRSPSPDSVLADLVRDNTLSACRSQLEAAEHDDHHDGKTWRRVIDTMRAAVWRALADAPPRLPPPECRVANAPASCVDEPREAERPKEAITDHSLAPRTETAVQQYLACVELAANESARRHIRDPEVARSPLLAQGLRELIDDDVLSACTLAATEADETYEAVHEANRVVINAAKRAMADAPTPMQLRRLCVWNPPYPPCAYARSWERASAFREAQARAENNSTEHAIHISRRGNPPQAVAQTGINGHTRRASCFVREPSKSTRGPLASKSLPLP